MIHGCLSGQTLKALIYLKKELNVLHRGEFTAGHCSYRPVY